MADWRRGSRRTASCRSRGTCGEAEHSQERPLDRGSRPPRGRAGSRERPTRRSGASRASRSPVPSAAAWIASVLVRGETCFVRRSLRLNAVTVHATTLCKILLQTRSPAPSESALPLWPGRCGSLDESRTVHGYRPTWLTRGPASGTRRCPEGSSSRKPAAMPHSSFTRTSSLLGCGASDGTRALEHCSPAGRQPEVKCASPGAV